MSKSFLHAIPLTTLSGVGNATVQKLNKLGICNVQDLLFHFPRRYEDRTKITSIAQLQIGQYATVCGRVQTCTMQKRTLLVTISDGTSKLGFRFFHFFAGMVQSFQVGAEVVAFGEVKRGYFMAEMTHPEYEIIQPNSHFELPQTLTAIYPSTEGFKQASWKKLIDQALALLEKTPLQDTLPTEFNPYPFDLKTALQFLHRPQKYADSDTQLTLLHEGKHPAQKRLAFEELLAHQLRLLKSKQQHHQLKARPLPHQNVKLYEPFLKNLGFTPTNAQKREGRNILQDLGKSVPMMRLLQGDVGAGKTLVAALAALCAVGNGTQVAIMAPTEILAEQHFQKFCEWFEPLGIQVAWLAGKVKGVARRKTLEAIADGSAQVIIGTQALFQNDVNYSDLALVIVDEQHRFGVEQRLQLREKGKQGEYCPHQLIMTATPIPRTLAMVNCADLDKSVLDELPPGRTPIQTAVFDQDRREELIARIGYVCREEKRQVYWVCTLVEESETLDAQAAAAAADDLTRAMPDLRIGLVHGRMKADEKQQVMQAFKAHELDLLVATTVIEVGVDVPNASVIVIENAERLGLAQLHQLRGRVGRGSTASFCVLLYKAPLGKDSRRRLDIMRATQDGFKIAEEDLKIRGAGELLGKKQTGEETFKVADLLRDEDLVPIADEYARNLFNQHPKLVDELIARWGGDRQEFAQS